MPAAKLAGLNPHSLTRPGSVTRLTGPFLFSGGTHFRFPKTVTLQNQPKTAIFTFPKGERGETLCFQRLAGKPLKTQGIAKARLIMRLRARACSTPGG